MAEYAAKIFWVLLVGTFAIGGWTSLIQWQVNASASEISEIKLSRKEGKLADEELKREILQRLTRIETKLDSK